MVVDGLGIGENWQIGCCSLPRNVCADLLHREEKRWCGWRITKDRGRPTNEAKETRTSLKMVSGQA